MKRKQADTAFSEFWAERGEGIANSFQGAATLYQVMKITFYWGWNNRGIQERAIAKKAAQKTSEGGK